MAFSVEISRRESAADSPLANTSDKLIMFNTIFPSYTRRSEQSEMLLLFSSHYQPIGPQPYPVRHVVANPVRGLLDRKISEEHLPSSNEQKQNANTHKKKTTKRKEQE